MLPVPSVPSSVGTCWLSLYTQVAPRAIVPVGHPGGLGMDEAARASWMGPRAAESWPRNWLMMGPRRRLMRPHTHESVHSMSAFSMPSPGVS